MSDPRPQYGEYASPEEQSRRAGRDLPVTPAPAEPVLSVPPSAAPARPAPAAGDAAAAPSWNVDRLITLVLLAYGLVNVITSAISYLDPSAFLTQMMQVLGIEGTFTNHAQAKVWGIAAAIVLILGWTGTAVWALSSLRRGKRSWWIPLVGAAVTLALSAVCMLVPFYGDPAVSSYLSGLAGR